MRTPLHEHHLALGARMTEFAGWQMPVRYRGIIEEHLHSRAAVSLFDTCHMSEFRVWGVWSEQALARALACRVEGMRIGRCRYGFLLAEDGGVLDDLICYRLAVEEFMVVANAGTRERDARVLEERLGSRAVFDDISEETGKLDLQGPGSLEALRRVSDAPVPPLRYYSFARLRVAGMEALVSRTGYTGELGFELYVSAERVAALHEALLEVDGVEPAGLGARDALRLEMGYPLYGHELDESVTPRQAGLGWALPPDERYVGAEGIARREPGRRLVGVCFEGRRAARAGDALLCDGAEAGRVTSGSYAPALGCAVALGYVERACAGPGTPLAARVRGRVVHGRVARLPFYSEGTVKAELPGEEGR